ncbi:MAG: Cell surface protein, partial [Candidatus Nomurabacteria bacterium GW2011_GWB1_37_5]
MKMNLSKTHLFVHVLIIAAFISGAFLLLNKNIQKKSSATTSSITFNSGTLTLSVDADGNNIANIGDTVSVLANITNTDSDGVDPNETTVTTDLSVFGCSASTAMDVTDELEGNMAENWGPVTCVITSGGIDVDTATQTVSITYSDSDDGAANGESGTLVEAFDNIVPIISTPGTVSLSNDIGVEGVASVGDEITYSAGSLLSDDGDTITVDLSAYGLSATAAPGVYTIIADDDNNVPFSATETVTDNAGNSTSGSTTNDFFNIDNVIPTLNNIHTESNNADTTQAIAGNTVYLSFDISETAGAAPTVTFLSGGNPVTNPPVNVYDNGFGCNDAAAGDNTWSTCYEVDAADTEGAVTFTIDYFDDGKNAGVQETTVDDASSVTVNLANSNFVDLYAVQQDGSPAASPARFWYYYDVPLQSLRFVLEANEPLFSARACVQSITSNTPAATCDLNEFTTGGTVGIDYILANDLGDNVYEFNTLLSDLNALPTTPGVYLINLYMEDMLNNQSLSFSPNSYAAVFGINPSTVAPLDNETTTDWSTIDDFTLADDFTTVDDPETLDIDESIDNLVFSAQDIDGELGRITLNGPLNLTAQATIDALINLGQYMTVSGDAIRIDSANLAAFDRGASLLMHVETGGVQPGLTVRDNNGDVLGSVSKNTCLGGSESCGGEEPIVIGGDTLNNFGWDAENENLTFDTTGFSEFDIDVTLPEVIWARITAPNNMRLVFSEPIATNDFTNFYNLLITGEEIPRTITDGVILTDVVNLAFDGDPVGSSATGIININSNVTDLVGNGLEPVSNFEVTDGQTAPDMVYVDDDWDSASNAGGHDWQFDAFDNIQDAVDAVAEGGTVNVASGTYTENITINKTISVIGEIGDDVAGAGLGAPIIRDDAGNTRTVNITASGVVFRGFVVENDGSSYPAVRIATNITNTTIKNNDLLNASTGVTLSPDSYENTVTKNKIYSTSSGIFINGSINNTLSYNEIYNNSYDGIEFVGNNDASGNNIAHNNIYDNASYGVAVQGSVSANPAILIENNTIDNNNVGIYVGSSVVGVSILGNTVTDNINNTSGIEIYSVDQVMIHKNVISNNGGGVDNFSGSTLDATRNYWGAANGPSGEGGGDGDSVGTNVDFAPYYTDEALTTLSDTTNIPIGDLSSVEVNTDDTDGDDSLNVFDLMTDTDGILSGEIPQITIDSTTSVGDVTV